MKIKETNISGCVVIKPPVFQDDRGRLVKTFHEGLFKDSGLNTNFREEYYSISKRDVLRGLHFQKHPHAHIKCVSCLSGRIFDAVVDLRKNSPTYQNHFTIELDAETGNLLYIPEGLAHGFFTLTENAIFLNRSTSVFNAEFEGGIRWDSCGIVWPTKTPILSEKDKDWIALDEFESPF